MAKNQNSNKTTLFDMLDIGLREKLFQKSGDNAAGMVDGFHVFLLATELDLAKFCDVWANVAEIAVDFEFDDNKNRYGRTLSVVQIFDGHSIALVDVLTIKKIDRLLQIFQNEQIKKIFHSCTSDLLILDELYHCKVKNIEDTSVIYKIQQKNSQDTSLKNLLSSILAISIEKSEQTSNWLERPLRGAQLTYAAKDVCYLINLRNLLYESLDLQDKNWYEDERKFLEKVKFKRNLTPYSNFLKRNNFSRKETFLALKFWFFRDQIARKADKPCFMIFADSVLADLVKFPPPTLLAWKSLTKCHHLATSPQFSKLFFEASQQVAATDEENLGLLPDEVHLLLQETQQEHRSFLLYEREEAFEKIREISVNFKGKNLKKILLSARKKKEFTLLGAHKMLKPWQVEIIEEICIENDIDPMLVMFSIFDSLGDFFEDDGSFED